MKNRLLIPGILMIAVLAITSCKEDDEPEDDLIGTWATQSVDIDAMIGNMTLLQYFTDVLGYTANEAQQYETIFNSFLEQNFTGNLTLRADNTYTANFGGQNETGTWSINGARTQLTIDPNDGDPVVLDVQRVSGNELVLNWTEVGSEDLNEDNVPETITADITMTLTKQ